MILSISAKLIFILLALALGMKPIGGRMEGDGPVIFMSPTMDSLIVHEEGSRLPKKTREMNMEATARNIAVIDRESGQILFERNAHEPVSIASITKLMSAYAYLEMNADGRRMVSISEEDDTPPAKIPVAAGDRLTVRDLLFSGLVGSANNAVNAFVRHAGISPFEFAQLMNAKAREWGLSDTRFVEPTGLDPENRSTAYEVALMARSVFKNRAIREITVTEEYSFVLEGEEEKYEIENTDKLLAENGSYDIEITGSKTGYLEEAGYCLVVQARNSQGNEIIAALLGSETGESRFDEMKALLKEIFASYEWPEKNINTSFNP